MFGDQSDDERQIFPQTLGVDFHHLVADFEGNLRTDAFKLMGNLVLIFARRAAVQHHADERRYGKIPGGCERIARRQRTYDRDDILHGGRIGDEINPADLRASNVLGDLRRKNRNGDHCARHKK